MAKNAKMKYPIKTGFTINNRNMAGGYRNGRPEGVLLHWNGNWKFPTIEAEIAYMTRNSINNQGGFTHAWSDDDEIIEIANTDYKCWGAGQYANARFAQIEALGIRDHAKAVASIDRALFWAAYQLYWYGLPCTDATKNGKGTVWTHLAATQFLGGTDHTDPIAYWESVGIKWSIAYAKLKEYYDALHKGDSTQVLGLHEKKKEEPKMKDRNYATNPDKEGRSTKFKRGQKVKTRGAKATHLTNGKPIDGWLHGQTLVVDWLNVDGTITVKPQFDTGKSATFTVTFYEWDLVKA